MLSRTEMRLLLSAREKICMRLQKGAVKTLVEMHCDDMSNLEVGQKFRSNSYNLYFGSTHLNPNRPQSNKIQQGEVKKMR